MSMTAEPQGTTLYVLVPPSPLFAAHWSFFLPGSKGYDTIGKRQEESTMGRRIHVSGDRLNGFGLEIIREYDVSKHRSLGSRKFPIGIVQAKHLAKDTAENGQPNVQHETKDDDEGGGFIDNNPRDDFECACMKVEAPGPSLNKVSALGAGPPGKKAKAEVRDCQWWVRQVVKELSDSGLLASIPQGDGAPGKNPEDLVKELPMH